MTSDTSPTARRRHGIPTGTPIHPATLETRPRQRPWLAFGREHDQTDICPQLYTLFTHFSFDVDDKTISRFSFSLLSPVPSVSNLPFSA